MIKIKKAHILFCFLIMLFCSTFVLGNLLIVKNASFSSSFERASFSSIPAGNATTTAKAMCVMEATSGRVLYAKNQSQKLAMASTTKIMTAITAIENCKNLDEKFTISPKSVGIRGTSIYLREGEALSIRELLYGLMLVSGNDASVAIGERVGGNGGVKNFVEMMNSLAKKIGALNTHFDNTHGLDSKNHYTTAEDLALITSYALKNPIFAEIVSTKYTKIINVDGKTRYLKNKNKLLDKLEGCNGVKTGFTDNAGRCLVSSCTRDNMTIVCVVLNCGPMFEESQELIEKAFSEFKLYDLSSFYHFKNYVEVENAKQEFVKLDAEKCAFYPLRVGELDMIKIEYSLPSKISAPVTKGQKVGKILIFYNNDLLFLKNIYTMEDIRSNTYLDSVRKAISNW